MKNLLKNNIIPWILIVLLIVNITAVLTMIYKTRNPEVKLPSPIVKRHGPPRHQRGYGIFKNHLNLSDQQHQYFRQYRDNYHNHGNRIKYELHKKRVAFLNELSKENIDSVKVIELAREFGALHEELKMETYRFYTKMRDICTPQQQILLKEFFMNIVDEERPPHQHFRKQRNRRR